VKRAHGDRTSGMRNPFEDVYPEYNYGIIKRKFIKAENGVWNLQDIPEKTRQSIVDHEFHGHGQRQIRIKAAELDHLSGIVTFGFVVEEEEPPRNVDPDKAKEFGILHTGRKYDLLKHGFSVQTEDGSRTVQPEEVWTQVKQRARKITITGDNRGWTPQMKEMSQNSDVLIHEATLINEDYSVSLCCRVNYNCNCWT
jgi:ribonuclease BN (tRNA processing enzyme)